MSTFRFQYSDKYTSDDDIYEYRAVVVISSDEESKITKLMTELEWKGLGVQQDSKWIHYANYPPDDVMLFRRLKKPM